MHDVRDDADYINHVMWDHYHKILLDELELIRDSNDQLRVASKYWYDKAKKKK